jgi:hypothetical protein
MKRAHLGRRDANEKPIADALRKAGCEVTHGKDVDLWVKRPATGLSKMIEVKMPGEELSLTPLQLKLAQMWQNDYCVVSSPERALAVMGCV